MLMNDDIEMVTEKIHNSHSARSTVVVPSANAQQRRSLLEYLKLQLKSEERIISLKGYFKLTKTNKNFSETYLFRDKTLEDNVYSYLTSFQSFSNLVLNYKNYDPTLEWNERPQHYAVRIISGNGAFASGKNIFAFFPEALGLVARHSADVIGLEFIDVWNNIFQQTINLCIKRVFDLPTQFDIFTHLTLNLDRTIYLASVFHEFGHRCGPWKVSPTPLSGIRIQSYHWGIMGEMATDSLLVQMLKDYPEIAYFVTLQRLFWFGRRGFCENPLSGMTNDDNDAWLGSYLWNQLIESGALYLAPQGKYQLHLEKLVNAYQNITVDLDQLGKEVLNTSPGEEQSQKVNEWMQQRVAWNKMDGFKLPAAYKKLLENCYNIPEQPQFSPPFEVNQFRDFMHSSSFLSF